MNHKIWYAINQPNILAGTTTRHGGVSYAPFATFNLAFQTGDNPEDVKKNRQIFSQELGIPLSQMVFTHQSHSTVLKRVESKDQGKGTNAFAEGIPADALYTTEKNILLGVFHADCVPVFLTHQHQPLVAIVHAGTPGSLNGITRLVIEQLVKDLSIQPADLFAHLGPSLDFAHHPIKPERKDELLKLNPTFRHVIKKIGGDFFLDIPLLNYLQLVDAGLKPENIHVSNLDTFSNPTDYYSYDRDGKTGRHVSFIVLK